MRDLQSILSLFPHKLNKVNNRGARMLDSLCHMILKLIESSIFGVKTSQFCHLLCNTIMDVIT